MVLFHLKHAKETPVKYCEVLYVFGKIAIYEDKYRPVL